MRTTGFIRTDELPASGAKDRPPWQNHDHHTPGI
jgi:hypothetical protein